MGKFLKIKSLNLIYFNSLIYLLEILNEYTNNSVDIISDLAQK